MSTSTDEVAEANGPERRRQPRFDLMAQVHVRRGRSDIIMELSNISATGALVHMGTLKRPGWLEIGRDVGLAIINPVDLESVDVHGEIVRIVEDGGGTSMGIEFRDLDDAQKGGIEALLGAAQSLPPPTRKRPPPLPTS